MNKLIAHLRTIGKHRRLVRKYCFKLGLYYQGLTHDLSKYSPAEFCVGYRYYQGTRSPNAAERDEKGYSTAWMHHKGRNRHHFEYWTDYSPNSAEPLNGVIMPAKYLAEMFCDRVAACHIYLGSAYDNGSAYNYYMHGMDRRLLHPQTREQLEFLLQMLKDKDEDAVFAYIKQFILKNKLQAGEKHANADIKRFAQKRR
jgi:hypothetical protein